MGVFTRQQLGLPLVDCSNPIFEIYVLFNSQLDFRRKSLGFGQTAETISRSDLDIASYIAVWVGVSEV